MKTFENLLHDEFDIVKGDALIVAADDELKQVVAQHFENHADVCSVHPGDFEIV